MKYNILPVDGAIAELLRDNSWRAARSEEWQALVQDKHKTWQVAFRPRRIRKTTEDPQTTTSVVSGEAIQAA